MTDAQLTAVIHDGRSDGAMPAFAQRLTAAQIKSVVAFLRILQGNQTSSSLPGSADSGKTLFYGKAGCSECHMVNGLGGFLGSDLSAYAGGLSVKEIHESITDPSRNLSLRSRSAAVVTKDGQTFRGQVRNQDNFSLQLQSEDGTFHLFQKSDIAKLSFPAGSLMPGDYGQKLTSAEISDLISYLMQVAAGNASRQKPPGEQLGELDAH